MLGHFHLLYIIAGRMVLGASYTTLEVAYGFLMVYDQIIHNSPNNLQSMASRYADYFQSNNATSLDEKYAEIFALMREGCRGTVYAGTSAGDQAVFLDDLVRASMSLIGIRSMGTTVDFMPVLSDCLIDVSCAVASPNNGSNNRGWLLFTDAHLWYSTTCAGANPILENCLCEARNVLIEYRDTPNVIITTETAVRDATLPHVANILQLCAHYTYLL